MKPFWDESVFYPDAGVGKCNAGSANRNRQSRGTDACVQEGAAAKLKTTEVEEAAVMTVVRKLTGGALVHACAARLPHPQSCSSGNGADEDPFDKEKGWDHGHDQPVASGGYT